MSGLFGASGGASGESATPSNAFLCPDEASMLGSNSSVNDTCFRTDTNAIFTLLELPSNILENWKDHPNGSDANTYDIATAGYELGNGENAQSLFNGDTRRVNFNRFKDSTTCIFYPVDNKFQILQAGFYSVDVTANLRSYSAQLTTGGENTLTLKKESQSGTSLVLAQFFDSILFGSAVIEERKASACITKTVYLDAGDFIFCDLNHKNNVSSGFCEILDKSLKITKIFGILQST